MGHWSDFLLGDLVRETGGKVDRQVLADALARAGREIDVLAGRQFNPAQRGESIFESFGLPFADVPNLLVGTMESTEQVRAIPDPVDPAHAAVLQLAVCEQPAVRAARAAEALLVAGLAVAQAYQSDWLSREFVLALLKSVPPPERTELFRRAMDPVRRINIPIFVTQHDGWWIQVTRRLIWATDQTPDEGRLWEFLIESDEDRLPLFAVEPVLIVAPMTQPIADWAFTARLWTEKVQVDANPKWSRFAPAIHGHGVPTITLDPDSTPQEIASQLVLKGFWHAYIGGDEPALADAVAAAYPKAVERVERGTGAPDRRSAAAVLLEGLLRPGFNPAQGAELTRRYVRRKANIAVMEHGKREKPQRYPWTRVGISERRYYKLLPQFVEKTNGRFDYDQDDVVERMKVHLAQLDRDRELRAAAMQVLISRGFGQDAARKWLQRHRPEDALTAQPRRPRTPEA
jgi:hypothetical protein